MPILPVTTSQIFSTLGNNTSSIVPVAIKDIISSAGIVHYFGKNGDAEHDKREKFTEEFGTQAIWLLGIPLVKKIFDKFVSPLASQIDPRVVKDKNYLSWAIEKAKNSQGAEKIADYLEQAAKNPSKYKTLFLSRFFTSTAVSLAALLGLIFYKQNTTKKKIEEHAKEKISLQQFMKIKAQSCKTFQGFTGGIKPKNPSFKGLGEKFMTNPMWNMAILDVGISGTRVATSRNDELGEIILKESTIVYMFYRGSKLIERAFNKIGDYFKKPLNLDNRVLDNLKLSKEGLTKDIKTYKDVLEKSAEGIRNFISDNPKNLVTQALKQSEIVQTIGKTDVINTARYIDPKNIKELVGNLENMVAMSEGQDFDKYLKSLKFWKKTSILANLTIACALLGIAQPLLVLGYRKMFTGDTKNPAAKNYEAQLMEKMQSKEA